MPVRSHHRHVPGQPDRHAELVLLQAVRREEFTFLDPRRSVERENVGRPRVRALVVVLLHTDDQSIPRNRQRRSEPVVSRSVRRQELLLLGPQRSTKPKDVRRSATRRDVVVQVRTHERGVAGQRDSRSKKIIRLTVRSEQLILLDPRCTVEAKDVRSSGIGTEVIGAVRADQRNVARQGYRKAEAVPGHAVSGNEFCFLHP